MLGLIAALLLTLPVAPANADAPPPNDDFAAALPLTGAPLDVEGTNVGATRETGEPIDAERGSSVWYAWTAPATGRYRIDTCGSDFQPALDVFNGTQLGELQAVPMMMIWCNTVSYGVRFEATGGATYRIAVSGTSSQEGAFRLGIKSMPHPTNDDFANAIELLGVPVTAIGTTAEAQEEALDPPAVGQGSVWYAWTAPATGAYRIRTCDSLAAPLVYSGTQLTDLVARTPYEYPWQTEVCDMGSGGSVVVRATEGEILRIPVSMREAWLARGPFTLEIDSESPPANDAFADAETLDGPTGGIAAAAGSEPGEPAHAGRAAEHSVWYEWTAPHSGPALLDVDGKVGVGAYTGSALAELVPLSTTAGPDGTLRLDAVAGTRYLIAVDWSISDTPGVTDGRFAVDMRPAPAPAPAGSGSNAPATAVGGDPPGVDGPATTNISKIARRPASFRGSAVDDKGVASVQIAIQRKTGRKCAQMTSRGAFVKQARCGAPTVWIAARGTTTWTYKLKRKLKKGSYTLFARATDSAGQVQGTFTPASRKAFKVR